MNTARATIAFVLAACFTLGLQGQAMAQKADRPQINEEEYTSLLFDFISVLPNTFRVQGTNPNGSSYAGTAYLSYDPQSGDLSVDWQIGQQQFSGRGPLIGGEFIVDWGQSSPVIYTVQRNGDLFGSWANGAAHETLTFAP